MANHCIFWGSHFLHGVCGNQNGDQMIEQILKPFDFITAMSITDQCQFFVGLSFAGFCFAAVLREACKDHHIRYVARALGAAAFFAVASFAMHATHQVEQLERELFVKEGKKASKITAESMVTLIGKNGHKIEVSTIDGLRRTCTEFRERNGCVGSGRGIHAGASAITTSRNAAGPMGRVGDDGSGDDGMVAARSVLEWAKRTAGDFTGVARDSEVPEFTGNNEGKDF
jgi:hypothetical protein